MDKTLVMVLLAIFAALLIPGRAQPLCLDTFASETATAAVTEYDEPFPGEPPQEIFPIDDLPEYLPPILPDDLTEILPLSDEQSRLESIDYSLKVISGGVVLTICSAFIWFTVLKPLYEFARF